MEALDQQIAAHMEAGTNWGELGMPKLVSLRQNCALRAGTLELIDRLRSGDVEYGEEAVLHPPAPEQAVAHWWREQYGYLAQLEWSAKQIQHTVYEKVPGSPLQKEDIGLQ